MPQPVCTEVKLLDKERLGTLHTTQINVTLTILDGSNKKFETEARTDILSWKMNACAGASDTTFAESGKIVGRKEHVKEAFRAGPSDFEYTNNLRSPEYPFDFAIA